jgi:hypothetical protein
MQTGYYGLPGKISTGKIHLLEDGKPLCLWHARRGAVFQFFANFPVLEYVTCKTCVSIYNRLKSKVEVTVSMELLDSLLYWMRNWAKRDKVGTRIYRKLKALKKEVL